MADPTNVRGENPGVPPRTYHDSLPIPGGRFLGDVPSDELSRTLIRAGVPGVSASNGRGVNADAYAAFLSQISAEAGNRAIAEWLLKNKGQ
jgi:hypothetical protein